jgi:hypothetical protein
MSGVGLLGGLLSSPEQKAGVADADNSRFPR